MMLAAAISDTPIVLLVGAILFLCGCAVGASARASRPHRPAPRRFVQPRHDLDRSRR